MTLLRVTSDSRCSRPECFARAVQRHHAVYEAEVRRHHGDLRDPRNLVGLCVKCHSRHHLAAERLPLHCLPDSVFEFAQELLGAGPAWAYLSRRYLGQDRRLDQLVAEGSDGVHGKHDAHGAFLAEGGQARA